VIQLSPSRRLRISLNSCGGSQWVLPASESASKQLMESAREDPPVLLRTALPVRLFHTQKSIRLAVATCSAGAKRSSPGSQILKESES
jgi:hypothetical protein